jgi:hypothetical protein
MTPTPALTQDQVHLIRNTWLALAPADAEIGQLFHQRLFEVDPALGRRRRRAGGGDAACGLSAPCCRTRC